MIQVNAMGDACPIPVVKTKKALQELKGPGAVETLVDNETAVQNLLKLAASLHYTAVSKQLEPGRYAVTVTVPETPRPPRRKRLSATAARRPGWWP